MRCARARRDILRALADQLPERRSRSLAAHLAACARCREEARQAGSLWREAGELAPPDPGPLYWEAFAARLRRRLQEPERGPAAAAPAGGVRQERLCRAAVAAAWLVAAALAAMETARPPAPDAASLLALALQAPGLAERVAPAALEVEDPDLDLHEALARLTPREAQRLLSRLEREMAASRLLQKETSNGS